MKTQTKEETDVVHYLAGARHVFLSLVFIHCQMSRLITLLFVNLFIENYPIFIQLKQKKTNLSLEYRRLSGTFIPNEEKSSGTSTRILIK